MTCPAVVEELTPKITRKILISDYTYGDQCWLDKLLTTAGVESSLPRLEELVVVAFERFQGFAEQMASPTRPCTNSSSEIVADAACDE